MAKNITKRKVAIVTGTRADYGLLIPVIRAVQNHARLELQLLVTGMHLLSRFGNTVSEIEADGWGIDARIRLQTQQDDPIAHSRGLGRAVTGFTNEFARLQTDIVVVLGDRLEMFAAAAAATASRRILAHIHGGDAAVGVQDDAYRHAISKLAHLHFAATAGAQKRLLQMGEQRIRVYRTGSPALDNLSKNICLDTDQLNRFSGIDTCQDFLMVLQHPAGGTVSQEKRRMLQTLRACHRNRLPVIVLYPNSDPGFSGIIQAASSFCSTHNYPLIRHLPRPIYLGLLTRTRALIGNSSSGIIEAGFLNVDVLNIGPRQKGRDRANNVCNVEYGTGKVSDTIENLLQRKRPARRKPSQLYGDGKSSSRIASILAKVKIDQSLWQKKIAY